MEQCGNCKFWKKLLLVDGLCRRYPPNGCGTLMPAQKMNSIAQPGKQQMHLQTLEYTVWPRTKENDVCGEYDGK